MQGSAHGAREDLRTLPRTRLTFRRRGDSLFQLKCIFDQLFWQQNGVHQGTHSSFQPHTFPLFSVTSFTSNLHKQYKMKHSWNFLFVRFFLFENNTNNNNVIMGWNMESIRLCSGHSFSFLCFSAGILDLASLSRTKLISTRKWMIESDADVKCCYSNNKNSLMVWRLKYRSEAHDRSSLGSRQINSYKEQCSKPFKIKTKS